MMSSVEARSTVGRDRPHPDESPALRRTQAHRRTGRERDRAEFEAAARRRADRGARAGVALAGADG